MSRRPFIAGNWKLNLGPQEAAELARGMVPALADRGEVDVAVFPTALSLTSVVPVLQGSGIEAGVQEVSTLAKGARTGCNSAAMARAVGCLRVLVGHSERRQYYGETDALVNARVRAGLEAGLLPIVCVGETLEQREADQTLDVVTRQLGGALEGLHADQVATITLAYEPVWAIGTGLTATPEQAQAVHAAIRGWMAERYPAYVSEQVRIQYGGSVKPANAAELLSCPDIDGALVGGASLKVESFAAIVAAARG